MNQAGNQKSTGLGYLLVRVSTALGAIPINEATVTVREHLPEGSPEERGAIIRVLLTDRDGKTEKIGLPTPPRIDSLSPYGGAAFSTYNIDVEAPGYYSQFFSNVPVYDTVTSIQPARLVPVSENGTFDQATKEDGFFQETTNPYLKAEGEPYAN